MRIPRATVAMILVLAATSCGVDERGRPEDAVSSSTGPDRRSVRIETVGCGYAADRTGSGVAIGDGVVITVAHLVAQAGDVTAFVADGGPEDAAVVAVDRTLDLAVLKLPSSGMTDIEMSSAGRGVHGHIVGAASSGTVPFRVQDVVSLSIEEVLGTERHSRLGYEIDATTGPGDSGAGAYDEKDRLIGIVFATSEDGGSSWLTASAEIERLLAADDPSLAPIPCTE